MDAATRAFCLLPPTELVKAYLAKPAAKAAPAKRTIHEVAACPQYQGQERDATNPGYAEHGNKLMMKRWERFYADNDAYDEKKRKEKEDGKE
jgi:hypothetical protein